MTHEELWLEIAEAFGTPVNERSQKQHHATCSGLCLAVEIFVGVRKRNRFERNLWGHLASWWLEKMTYESDAQRCLFACFMAAMPEKDYNEMVNP